MRTRQLRSIMRKVYMAYADGKELVLILDELDGTRDKVSLELIDYALSRGHHIECGIVDTDNENVFHVRIVDKE